MDPIYTIPVVASYLKISKSKLYDLAKRKQIPVLQIGRNIRIRESDLIRWMEEQTQFEESSIWSSLLDLHEPSLRARP